MSGQTSGSGNDKKDDRDQQGRDFRNQMLRRVAVFGIAASAVGALAVSANQPNATGTPSGTSATPPATSNTTPSLPNLPSSATNQIKGVDASGTPYVINNPQFTYQAPENPLVQLGGELLPLLLIGGFAYFIIKGMRKAQMGAGGIGAMTQTKGKISTPPNVKWSDIAGYDYEKQKFMEFAEFLVNPEKFTAVGAKPRKGILLAGPPGTGKTLMARAAANEAGASFFAMSGSEFVEMIVGVGAGRVRNLFKQARENQPAIIFIDELDAIGGKRGAESLTGGHSEREQTLNQILTEMDGFDNTDNILVVAATNRPDMLDPALLREGRFHQPLSVGLPDQKTRREILEIHARGVPLATDVDLDSLAYDTPGFSGAGLASLINEAALSAAHEGASEITEKNIRKGFNEAAAGPESGTILQPDERELVSWHEAGHAVAAQAQPKADPVRGISIVPRGQSLGHTLLIPDSDRALPTKDELMAELVTLYGGRVAELMLRGDGGVTPGLRGDIGRATDIATKMVCEWGMAGLAPYVHPSQVNGQNAMDDKAREEVAKLVNNAYEQATKILTDNKDLLKEVAGEVEKRQDLTREEFLEIVGRVAPKLLAKVPTAPAPATPPTPQKPAGPDGGLAGTA